MPAPRTARAVLVAAGTLVLAWPALAQDRAPPRVLKGSAIPPATLERSTPDVVRYQISAGEDLWLVDREEGRLIACELLNTSTVNRQIIRCWQGSLPRRF